MAAATFQFKYQSVAIPPVIGHTYFCFSVKIACSQSVAGEHIFRCALKDYIASFAACTRTDIDQIVGLHHYILVVLHHDYGV